MIHPNEGGDGVGWVYLFLSRIFFQPCVDHTGERNQQNRYCIDCEMASCRQCITEGIHAEHRVISIYKLSQRDVVDEVEMRRHYTCSRIQRYTSNGKQVLALHPLPHYNSGKIYPHRACLTCTRVLMNPECYDYCSIECKVFIQPAAGKNKGDAGSKSGAGGHGGGGSGKHSKRSQSRARKRKGVPHRAPV